MGIGLRSINQHAEVLPPHFHIMKNSSLISILCFLTLYVSNSTHACELVTTTDQQPTDDYSSTLVEGVSAGTYIFNGTTVNTYKKAIKQTFDGVPPPSDIDGIPLNSCVYNPYPIRDCEYLGEYPRTCGTGYTLQNGQCELTDIVACQTENPTICEDGYPLLAGYDLGYETCDRPAIKQCVDQTYVLAESICTSVCWDFETCLVYAQDNISCSTNDLFEFQYIDPTNWTVTCTTIEPDSPDLADNGGNQDGDPYNDPNSPPPPTSVTEVHPDTLASVIDNALQNDFANVERAIRTNTDTLSNDLGTIDSTNEQGFSNVTTAIETLSSSLDGGVSLNDIFWAPSPTSPGTFPDKSTEIESLKTDLNSQINMMKSSIGSMFSFSASTSPGALPCWRDLDFIGNPVDICLDDYREELSPIALVILFFAGIMSISIVLRRA